MPAADAFVRSGKVRDLFSVDDDRLLLVASDRMSAFDVVLPTEIPDKGRVLTGHLALVVRRDGRHRARTTSSRRTRPTSPMAGSSPRPWTRAPAW